MIGKVALIIAILSLCLAACGSGGDDYGSDYIHVVKRPEPVREHKEFTALAGLGFLLFLALRRSKALRILLVLVLLLGMVACRGDGGKGGKEHETSHDNGVYYIMGEGFGQKEFAILVAITLITATSVWRRTKHETNRGRRDHQRSRL